MKNLILYITLITSTTLIADESAFQQDQTRPVFFVHGCGPKYFSGLRYYKKMFAKSGFPESNLHKIEYDWKGTYKGMSDEIASKIKSVLKYYPKGTQIDVMGYSLGTITSFRAILEHDLPVHTYISLAGAENGQHAQPANCKYLKCSDIYDFMIPYRNERIVFFHERYAEKIKNLKKCMIYSFDDGSLDPVDASVFPDSIAISFEGVTHLQLRKSPEAFNAIMDRCY